MSKRKVYIAASYTAHALAEEIAGILKPYCEVVSTWHKNVVDEDKLTHSEKYHAALNDLRQIKSCNVLLYLSTPHKTNGGRYFETGYVFAQNKPVYIAGEDKSVFGYLFISAHHFFHPEIWRLVADAINKHTAALEAKH